MSGFADHLFDEMHFSSRIVLMVLIVTLVMIYEVDACFVGFGNWITTNNMFLK